MDPVEKKSSHEDLADTYPVVKEEVESKKQELPLQKVSVSTAGYSKD